MRGILRWNRRTGNGILFVHEFVGPDGVLISNHLDYTCIPIWTKVSMTPELEYL